MYLKALKTTIESVEESEFDQVEPRLAPVLHTLCLVWANSSHYRMPSRIIVVLQEICNLLIRIVSTIVNCYSFWDHFGKCFSNYLGCPSNNLFWSKQRVKYLIRR